VSTPVVDRPATLDLQATQAGRPVSHRHGRAWQDTLSFLLGHNAQVVASFGVPRHPSASSADVFIAYRRSPGARALLVAVELHTPTTDGAACAVEASLVSGSTVYLPTPDTDLAGVRALVPQFGRWADIAQAVSFVDVSALTVGALEWLRVRWTDGTPSGTRGVAKVHVVEVPRRALAEDSSDAGVDGGWCFTGNPLVDGSPTSTRGTVRLLSEIDRARTDWRNFRQFAAIESIADAWFCGASVGTWAPVLFGRSTQPGMNCRARRLYKATTDNRLEFVCRYTTQHATAGAELRITATSQDAGGASVTVVTTTLALPASLGWSASTPVLAPIPCDGTDQMVRVVVDFKTDAGADLRLSHRGWIEAEV
jgi:hypothetical protein